MLEATKDEPYQRATYHTVLGTQLLGEDIALDLTYIPDSDHMDSVMEG